MRFEDVRSGLKELAALGTRILYLEGGEPFLWRDGGRTADDIMTWQEN
jgi:MoaA/NifB/PqqE/SkfB family radical SAM enzyme